MLGRRYTLLVVFAALLAASPLKADSPAEIYGVIPDSALGFAVVHRLSDTCDRIDALAKKFDAGLPSVLPLLKTLSGLREGVDDSGSIGAALFADSTQPGALAFAAFVPVTDYKKLLATMKPEDDADGATKVFVANRPMLIGSKDKFAVFVAPKDAAVLRAIQASTVSLEKTLEPIRPWLVENDAAVVALPAGVMYGMSILQTALLANQAAKLAGGARPQAAENAMVKRLETIAQQVADGIKTNITHGGIGLNLDRDGAIRNSLNLALAPDKPLSKSLAEAKWPDKTGLDSLPRGPFIAGGSVSVPPAWAKALVELNLEWSKDLYAAASKDHGPAEKDLQNRMAALSTLGTQNHGASFVIRRGKDNLLANSCAIMYMDDAPKFLATYREEVEQLSALYKQLGKPPAIAVRPVEIEGLKGIEVTADMVAALAQSPQVNVPPPITSTFKAIFGNDQTVVTTILALDPQTIITTYGNPAVIQQIRKTVQSGGGFASDPVISGERKLLPEGAQWLLYFDLGEILGAVNQVLTGVGVGVTLPSFPEAPPVAVGVRFDPRNIESRKIVPAAVIDAIAQYLKLLRNAAQAPGAPAVQPQ